MNSKNYIPKLKIAFLAIFIGLLTGIVSILFNKVLNIGFHFVGELYQIKAFMIIVPLIAAMAVAYIRHRLLTEDNQGFGVEQVMFEIEHIKTQMMTPSAVLYKTIGTFLTLISGFAAGRQGPVVHLGGAIGSHVAYRSKLSDDETRVLIGCGVAGCLAGIFNSPIFATLFVVEILFKKRYFDMLSTILLSSLASTLTVRIFLDQPYFSDLYTNYLFHMSEVVNFILLGFIIGFLSILYMLSLKGFRRLYHQLKIPQFVKNLSGAVVIIIMLYSVGNYFLYNPSPAYITAEHYSAGHLFVISLLMILLTGISLGSGAIGGIFAPGLVIGLTFGLGLSKVFVLLGLPLLDVNTYAMAGMAAIFAGFGNAPLSASLMVVELTGQYNLLFPMLVCSLISSKIAEFFMHDSIYHQNLELLMHNE
ncbi:chloride channel protein [Acidaminobacter sp. JC074]|uniref:chloride channel protein n=1 Tax=Acidaminobacter sp. JC074 TaxID=2530199 RepID=UPI001F0FFEF2|nr:chloride channel protein [Acidaminobacter sp. JC074]MCH4889467.1 chloride channel protein [Acidaminobacter sp. JC074]